MRIQRLVCVLLAVLLLAGFVGCVSGAISTVEVKLTAPTTGGETTTATTTTSGVNIATSWIPTPSGGTFDANTTYIATITLTNKTGYTFSNSPTVTLNGDTVASSKITEKSTTKIVFKHTFSKTDAAVTTTDIELKLTKPAYTLKPATATDITISKPTKGLKITKVTWSPNDSAFKLDEEYTVTIEVESTNSKAYPISTSVDAEINGYDATVSSISSSKATITYKFGKTEPLGTIKTMNLGVNAPSVGKAQSSTVNTNSEMCTANAVWNPSGTFQPDTSYTVTVTVNAKYGYLMDTSLTAKVNGADAYVERVSDTQAKVTYTFGQIASVDSVDIGFIAPATGEKAQTSANSIRANTGTTNSATIKWTPQLSATGEFEAGVEYTAEVTFSIAGNVVFDKNTIVKINGNTAEVRSISSDSKSMTVTYTFPKTSFIPNPIEIIKEFFNLMKAMINPAMWAFF